MNTTNKIEEETLEEQIKKELQLRGAYVDDMLQLDPSELTYIIQTTKEAVLGEERERIYNKIYHSLPTGEVTAWDWTLWAKDVLHDLTEDTLNK